MPAHNKFRYNEYLVTMSKYIYTKTIDSNVKQPVMTRARLERPNSFVSFY